MSWAKDSIEEALQFYTNAKEAQVRCDTVTALTQYSLSANTLWNVKSILERGMVKKVHVRDILGSAAGSIEEKWCRETIRTIDNTMQRVLKHVQHLKSLAAS